MRRFKRNKKKIKIHIFSVKEVKDAVKKSWPQVIFTILLVALIALMGTSLNSFLFASEYFNITEIEVVDQEPDEVNYPLAWLGNNPNIFKVNLDQVAENIEYEYSDIQKAIVKRVLPNKLVIEVLRRRPVAQIVVGSSRDSQEKDSWFTVNKDGYILSAIGGRPKSDLPVVYGLDLAEDEIEIGHTYMQTDLKYALSFLEELNRSKFLEGSQVTKIDISQPRSMSFFIKDMLEVKIGDRNWKEKIENLAGILENMDVDYSQEYYVDLRFKDFVFGKK